MSEIKFKITNITCGACVKLSTMALEDLPGVSQIKIDELSGLAEITADPAPTWEEIYSTLKTVGKIATQI